MPGKKIITERQWKLLLDYMEANPEFAMGLPHVRHESGNLWCDLTRRLNAEGFGRKRSEKGWRDYWNQAKYKARTKACTVRKQLKTIMKGGPIKLLVLSKNEKRVLRILRIPLPEIQLGDSPLNATQANPSQPHLEPPDGTPPEASLGLEASVKPLTEQNTEQDRTESEESDAEEPSASSTCSLSPPLESSPQPTKTPCAYESAASPIKMYSNPYGSTARKKCHPAPPSAAEWVRHIEERRIAVEERSSRALQGIQANSEFCASALKGIHVAQERMNQTLQGIQSALEASVRALQGRQS